MNIIYTNNSTKLFPGFYESLLFNSDTFYNMNLENGIPKGYTYDVKDFNAFTNDIASECTNVLWASLPNDIISDIKYIKLDSPAAYNFRTDKLVLDIKFNAKKLKRYCIKEHSNEFNKYLYDHFTSYDGFISFVKNNIKDFINEFNNNKGRSYNIMLEFYILNNIDTEQLLDEYYYITTDALFQYANIYREDDYELNNPINHDKLMEV